MNRDELKKKLNPLQFEVMCNEGTEPPFQNEYWDNKRPGIYVDRISGVALFSSLNKFDSGTGWPSFTTPIDSSSVENKLDLKLGIPRTEVKSKSSGAHLGHVFDDGPLPTKQRYCMNSASLRFVPLEELEAQGLGQYKKLFDGLQTKKYEEAMFGAGCFWGVEDIIRKIPGVIATDVGYAGGETTNPTYLTVKTGKTGHAEVLWVQYDTALLSYQKLLEFFFRLHDPTTENRQGNDIGTQYRSVIFTKDEKENQEAREALKKAQSSGRWKSPIVTEIRPWDQFWKAEEYHQDYLVKNPNGYTCHWLRD